PLSEAVDVRESGRRAGLVARFRRIHGDALAAAARMLRDVHALAELRAGAPQFQIAVRPRDLRVELQQRVVFRAAGLQQLSRGRDDLAPAGEPALAVLLTAVALGHELDLHVLRVLGVPDAVMIREQMPRAPDQPARTRIAAV